MSPSTYADGEVGTAARWSPTSGSDPSTTGDDQHEGDDSEYHEDGPKHACPLPVRREPQTDECRRSGPRSDAYRRGAASRRHPLGSGRWDGTASVRTRCPTSWPACGARGRRRTGPRPGRPTAPATRGRRRRGRGAAPARRPAPGGSTSRAPHAPRWPVREVDAAIHRRLMTRRESAVVGPIPMVLSTWPVGAAQSPITAGVRRRPRLRWPRERLIP